jgi:hypothetical protein
MEVIPASAPAVSVIVVSWNVKDALRACLASLRAAEGVEAEIIVVDNASEDGTQELLREAPGLVVIQNEKNRGFAAAVNQGVARAQAPAVVLANPDLEVFPDTLRRIAGALKEEGRIGALGGKVMNADGSIQRSVHRFPSFLDQMIVLLKLRTLLSGTPPMRRYLAADFSYDRRTEADQVLGALFAFRKEVFVQLGGFDERYFLWFEEVDFCKRVKAAGLAVVYDPSIRARHLGGQSFARLSPIARHMHLQRSLVRYFAKFHPPQQLFLLPFAAIGTLFAVLASLLPRGLFRRLTKPSYVE